MRSAARGLWPLAVPALALCATALVELDDTKGAAAIAPFVVAPGDVRR